MRRRRRCGGKASPPPPPLPVRDGLGPARLRVQGGNVAEEFARRFGEHGRAKVLAGEVVDSTGTVLDGASALPAGVAVYLYRDLPDEVEVPHALPVLHRDDNIVVADKPHFLATTPRGGHVTQTALVRLRRELDLPDLTPAHRLDRLTAGVLLFTARPEVRGAYQSLFARGEVAKTYLARSSREPGLSAAQTISNRIVKRRGRLQASVEAGPPNARTLIEPLGEGRYRLTPGTGRTHQLRVHMAGLGLPIDNDPLYPEVVAADPADFSRPLQLVAHRLEFTDPLSGRVQRWESRHRLGVAGS
ncbi:MAG: pseudouridine synthase [Mycobacterium sp.]|nr:pseudouridine synthase [Mycobacterium sp.]